MTNYSNNVELNQMIESAVSSIEQGAPATGLVKMLKIVPTGILKASSKHAEARYRPGNQLVTYTGMDAYGIPIQETWNDGIANIDEDSVILRNGEPIRYAEGDDLEGHIVKGKYDSQGKFTVDPLEKTVLFNEYVSDVKFVSESYGIQATEEWQEGLKLQPSYVMQIPSELGDVSVYTQSGTEIRLAGGDYVIMDAKKNKVSGVRGIEKNWLSRTYVPLEEHLKRLQK